MATQFSSFTLPARATPIRASRSSRSIARCAVTKGPGQGGLDTVTLARADGTSAQVYLFGGVVTSFKPKGAADVLYVRPDAKFDKSKPISGGLPHCWPQFGPGKIQVHGFARNVDWTLVDTKDGEEPSMTMELTPNAYTKAMWDKAFKVVETVTLKKNGALEATLTVHNQGKEAFDFTGSFHTYLAADINAVAVGGLNGCKVFDRLASKESTVSGDVKIAGPVDSVYSGRPETLTLKTGKRTVTLKGSKTWTEAVVWSPWTDMPACYKEFVCVEDAAVTPVVVPAGGKWTATTTISV